MQRDDHILLNDVYSTPESLHESIEKVIDRALYKVSSNLPLKLRFITPVSQGDWLRDDNYNDYRLTRRDEHDNDTMYVTVSYCWKHTQSSQNLPLIPRYRILNSSKNSEPTPISCPPLVFHRAMLFARLHGCPRVWIDQECIDQTDPVDIRAHLEIMHRIYEESWRTVAPLSFTLTDRSLLEVLISYLYDTEFEYGSEFRLLADIPTEIQDSIRFTTLFVSIVLLDAILDDAWFTRTWAFQEKLCSSSLFLLIPTEGTFGTPNAIHPYLIGTDLCLDPAQVQRRLSNQHIADIGQVLEEIAPRNRPSRTLARIQSNYITSIDSGPDWYYGTSMDSGLHWRHGYHSIFQSLQDCENLVVADRIAIFGHVCRFRYRLNSNLLDSADYSYSSCIMALLYGNIYSSGTARFEHIREVWFMLQQWYGITSLPAYLFILWEEYNVLILEHGPYRSKQSDNENSDIRSRFWRRDDLPLS